MLGLLRNAAEWQRCIYIDISILHYSNSKWYRPTAQLAPKLSLIGRPSHSSDLFSATRFHAPVPHTQLLISPTASCGTTKRWCLRTSILISSSLNFATVQRAQALVPSLRFSKPWQLISPGALPPIPQLVHSHPHVHASIDAIN